MKVAGGTAKGMPLRSPKVPGVRPTTDRVRNALFNILAPLGLEGAVVADFYAGTGSLGIEALSRGAAHADFVETHARQCADIQANLAAVRFQDRGKVWHMTAEQALKALDRSYHLVLMDPPYQQPFPAELLEALAESPLLEPDAVVVVGHPSRRPAPARCGGLVQWQDRPYGDSSLAFYRHGTQEASS